MRTHRHAIAISLACSLAAACGGKVSEDSVDGGASAGPDDCAKFCHFFDGTSCTILGKPETCTRGCLDSLATCDAETRAFLSCALRPGLLSCDVGSAFLAACESKVLALADCNAKHDAGGGTGSGGSGGVGGGSSPPSSGSAPPH